MRGYCCDYFKQVAEGTWDGPENYAENTKLLEAEQVLVSSPVTGSSGDTSEIVLPDAPSKKTEGKKEDLFTTKQ